MFKKIGIIGVGLIGGSLGLAIKKNRIAHCVVGVARTRETLTRALSLKAIDYGSSGLEVLRGADCVIFATSVNAIMDLAEPVAGIVGKECLVTDVGSTKEKIVSVLSRNFAHYVGSHPLAGSEKRGIQFARPDLFKDSLCILTPTVKTRTGDASRVKRLWSAVGARTVLLSPAAHDEAVSFVSHLPHLAAFSLIASVPEKYLRFAANGLKDTTRIAASESDLWADIFLSNKHLLKSTRVFCKQVAAFETAIRRSDRKLLVTLLRAAQVKRLSI